MVAKKSKPKPKVTSHKAVLRKMDILVRPKYSEMIRYAISSLKERNGSSRQAILKFITAFYDVGHDVKAVNNYLKQALRAGVKNGKLMQSRGTGASGSFRLGDGKKNTKLGDGKRNNKLSVGKRNTKLRDEKKDVKSGKGNNGIKEKATAVKRKKEDKAKNEDKTKKPNNVKRGRPKKSTEANKEAKKKTKKTVKSQKKKAAQDAKDIRKK